MNAPCSGVGNMPLQLACTGLLFTLMTLLGVPTLTGFWWLPLGYERPRQCVHGHRAFWVKAAEQLEGPYVEYGSVRARIDSNQPSAVLRAGVRSGAFVELSSACKHGTPDCHQAEQLHRY